MKKITLYKVEAPYDVTDDQVALYEKHGVKNILVEYDEEKEKYTYIYGGGEIGGSLVLKLLPHVTVKSKRDIIVDESELEDVDE